MIGWEIDSVNVFLTMIGWEIDSGTEDPEVGGDGENGWLGGGGGRVMEYLTNTHAHTCKIKILE